MPSSPITPSAVTAQNVDRQPNCCPSAVPPGTPSTFATVSPVNISAIALACFAFGTSGRDHRADPEERSVGQRGHDPSGHQTPYEERGRRAGCPR